MKKPDAETLAADWRSTRTTGCCGGSTFARGAAGLGPRRGLPWSSTPRPRAWIPPDKVIELALVKFEYDRGKRRVGRVSMCTTDSTIRGCRSRRIDRDPSHHGRDGAGPAARRGRDRSPARRGGSRHRAQRRLRPAVRRGPPARASLHALGLLAPGGALGRAGLGSAKLDYLAYRYGFFFEGHRAEIDCRALLEVLRRPVPEQPDSANARARCSSRHVSRRADLGHGFAVRDQGRAQGARLPVGERQESGTVTSSDRTRRRTRLAEGGRVWREGRNRRSRDLRRSHALFRAGREEGTDECVAVCVR